MESEVWEMALEELEEKNHEEWERNVEWWNGEEYKKGKRNEYKPKIIWKNAIAITAFHIIAFFAFIMYAAKMKLLTALWAIVMSGIAGFGVTGGAHRLWTHRSYKAKLPLQIILLVCYSAAGQNTIFEWVRDHRVHHKFSETDADPHNSNRGFFFSHVGWLMQKKHPEVIAKGKSVDMSDIIDDPLLQLHTKYFLLFKLVFCFLLPTVIPVYLWDESWKYAIVSQALLRYAFVLNATWSVNSFAHIWGYRPYDRKIRPVENIGVAFFSFGEGWHNYHHVFPWDYKAAELGSYLFNYTTMLLDVFAKIGWAYDMKTASPELIQKIAEKHGDGSHAIYSQNGY